MRIVRKKRTLTTLIALSVLSYGLFYSCKRENNPKPPKGNPKDSTTYPIDSTGPSFTLKKGLLLYLPFNGTMADSSGNANPTSGINGASLTSDKNGDSSKAFGSNGAFNGGVVLVTNNGSIKFDTAYTLSFNFMVRTTGRQAYISMVNYNTGEAPTFLVGPTWANLSKVVTLAADSSAGCDNYGTTNPNAITDTTNFTPVVGTWYNLVYIYHRGTVQIFINGQLNSTKSVPGGTAALLCPSAQIVVGGWWSGVTWNLGNLNINGKLDEVRLYNRVLTGTEISALSQGF